MAQKKPGVESLREPEGEAAALLDTVGQLQDLVSIALAAYHNDRAPDRADRVVDPLTRAHELCIRSRSRFPVPASRGEKRKRTERELRDIKKTRAFLAQRSEETLNVTQLRARAHLLALLADREDTLRFRLALLTVPRRGD